MRWKDPNEHRIESKKLERTGRWPESEEVEASGLLFAPYFIQGNTEKRGRKADARFFHLP